MSPAALEATAAAVGLGAARAVPVTWMVSPLGGGRLPVMMRVGLGMLLAMLRAPALASAAAAAGLARASAPALVLLVTREILVGLTLGLVVSFAFRAAEAAGRLADTLRGANVAEILVPTADERSSPLGALYLLVATALFLEIGGVPRLVESLGRSYQAVPMAAVPSAAGAARAAALVGLASARLIESALGLAAPVVVALWLADLALGLVARAAPQLPVYFVGLPLKGLLGVAMVLLGLGVLETTLGAGFAGWLDLARRAVGSWR
jgi:type III secretory pathway component EscT